MKNMDLACMSYIDLLEPYFSKFQGTIKIHVNRGERKSNNWKSFRILSGVKLLNLLLSRISH